MQPFKRRACAQLEQMGQALVFSRPFWRSLPGSGAGAVAAVESKLREPREPREEKQSKEFHHECFLACLNLFQHLPTTTAGGTSTRFLQKCRLGASGRRDMERLSEMLFEMLRASENTWTRRPLNLHQAEPHPPQCCHQCLCESSAPLSDCVAHRSCRDRTRCSRGELHRSQHFFQAEAATESRGMADLDAGQRREAQRGADGMPRRFAYEVLRRFCEPSEASLKVPKDSGRLLLEERN